MTVGKLLLLWPLLIACTIGCSAHSGYVPISTGPTLEGNRTCSFFRPVDEPGLAAGLRDIAHAPGTAQTKAAQLRALLPKAHDFADFHAALCFAAAQRDGLITADEYYYLLDTLAPVAARARSRDTAQSLLVAPEPVAPADSTVFDQYPRRTRVGWTDVAGARSYLVEVEILLPEKGYRPQVGASGHVTSLTEDTFGFTGANWGRWRVRALNAQGESGRPSTWRYFRYLR